jgi:L-ribulokinase
MYKEIYPLYRQLHDAFGTPQGGAHVYNVMKQLIDLRQRARS